VSLVDLAENEEEGDTLIDEVKENFEKFNKELLERTTLSRFSGEHDKTNAILMLHSGAGGTEACDWTEMLLRMYQKWAERKRYQVEIIDILPGEEAGIKSITCVIKGNYAYGWLKNETGVHRLVRISPFDANKRRHTSFASVDAIPEVSADIQIDIRPEDLRIDTYRASGHGGQHVNKTDSAVRVTHIPSGIVTQCQSERSQHQNKARALELLRARLYEHERRIRDEKIKKQYAEKDAIGWGSQIRSYVFCPYTMVKDHRTDRETGNIQAVMDGNIDMFLG